MGAGAAADTRWMVTPRCAVTMQHTQGHPPSSFTSSLKDNRDLKAEGAKRTRKGWYCLNDEISQGHSSLSDSS